MSDKRRNDELEGEMSEEMELEIDEAVAAADEDGTPVPSGLGRFPLVPSRDRHLPRDGCAAQGWAR